MGLLSAIFNIFDMTVPTVISSQTREAVEREWRNIAILRKKAGPSQLRQAVISADKTLDNILRDIAEGQTMGERLKSARNRFDPDMYRRIWSAHKTRNMLVHESGYEPGYRILEEAIDDLKEAVNKLGVTVE